MRSGVEEPQEPLGGFEGLPRSPAHPHGQQRSREEDARPGAGEEKLLWVGIDLECAAYFLPVQYLSDPAEVEHQSPHLAA